MNHVITGRETCFRHTHITSCRDYPTVEFVFTQSTIYKSPYFFFPYIRNVTQTAQKSVSTAPQILTDRWDLGTIPTETPKSIVSKIPVNPTHPMSQMRSNSHVFKLAEHVSLASRSTNVIDMGRTGCKNKNLARSGLSQPMAPSWGRQAMARRRRDAARARACIGWRQVERTQRWRRAGEAESVVREVLTVRERGREDTGSC